MGRRVYNLSIKANKNVYYNMNKTDDAQIVIHIFLCVMFCLKPFQLYHFTDTESNIFHIVVAYCSILYIFFKFISFSLCCNVMWFGVFIQIAQCFVGLLILSMLSISCFPCFYCFRSFISVEKQNLACLTLVIKLYY